MGNMSYCRFENTLDDLRDCQEAMGDDDLGESEQRARAILIRVCGDIAADYGEEPS